ncbi:MAG TPA: penicillin-binding transpeptidase domain-containing protein [Solirubrobacteraceae bacterium]
MNQLPPEDRRSPLTPQLALRVALIGSFALALFAIIFFRLWFLQVLSGQAYAQQAQTNYIRTIDVSAPRGQILDRSGNVLVDSRRAIAVEISPPDLPVPLQLCDPSTQLVTGLLGSSWASSCTIAHPPVRDITLYDHLASVLGMPTARQKCPVNGYGMLHLSPVACAVATSYVALSYADATIKVDVPNDVLYYLEERQAQFPGVVVHPVWLRTYPLNDLAAQLFGTVGPISCDAYLNHQRPNAQNCELKDPRFKGLPANATVGQSGLELSYNQYLQGTDGSGKLQVNAQGQFIQDLGETQPTPGANLRLSLDVSLQRAGEAALQNAVNTIPNADGGAFVALNPLNGEVYAMGSNPSFNPNIFTKPVPEKVYQQLNSSASNYPLLDRATQTAGPTGSTFKPITATAALQSGAISTGYVFDDTGQFCFSGQCRHNAGMAVDGVLDLVQAIKVSSDDFFYNLGVLTNNPAPNGGALQHWARLFGIGQPTGIDSGYESAGTLPTPTWRTDRNRLEAECDSATGPFKGRPKHAPGGCGLADGTNRPWSAGDNENLAVGQGDVQVTPLQLAVAYSAIANMGTIVTPHLGLAVQSATNGNVLREINPPAKRNLNINPLNLETIRQGLRAAASQPGGTSFPVMGNFPEQVYGKTGTAQYTGQPDYSWYACFVPPSATSKPIVVIVTVARAGFGVQAAAPVARQILSQWFFGNPGQFMVSTTGGAL